MPVPLGDQTREPKKLILCFDGTGNTFTGSNADTNVIKILNKLDRFDTHQYYYYQPGVGTYDIDEKSVHKTWLGDMRSGISKTIDQAIGTTFDAHVMAGYRFLMRFYEPVRVENAPLKRLISHTASRATRFICSALVVELSLPSSWHA